MLIGNWLVAVVVPSSVAFEQYSVSIRVICQVIKVSGAGVLHGQVCSYASVVSSVVQLRNKVSSVVQVPSCRSVLRSSSLDVSLCLRISSVSEI